MKKSLAKAPLSVLFELGCEEIPARFMTGFLDDLKKHAEEKLQAARLSFSNVRSLGTPRRLVLHIEDLAGRQPDITEEAKGPPAEVAFKDGKPTPAAIGFARGQGIDPKNLVIKAVGSKNYVFATVTRKGQAAEKVLVKLLPEIVSSIYLPLSMRWQDLDYKFVRPIHWILALCGKRVLNLNIAGIKASNLTYGHRFNNLKIKIQSSKLDEYKQKLLKAKVIVDQDERKLKIRAEVKKAAPRAHITEDLLNEVNYLVEYPAALLCKFEKEYLSVPKDVLITSMQKNQKYFPVLDEKGKLTENFVVVTNNSIGKNIKEGNQRVISARLADAKFFFEEDKKVPLKVRINDLKRVEFFEKLGSLYDKTERLMKLSEWLALRLKVDKQFITPIKRAAELSKADLTTQMVFEFPELQGIIGREYALLSGEDKLASDGIREHYLPHSAEDEMPSSMVGTIVSLADKLDNLVGAFSLGKKPTGSADPYGLRRAAYGLVRIILKKDLDLLLDETLEEAYKLYLPVFTKAKRANIKTLEVGQVTDDVLKFLAGRLKAILLDEKVAYDAVDAALAEFNDITEDSEIAKAISRHKGQEWLRGIVKSCERVLNISKGASREQVIEHDLIEDEEKKLHELYLKINWNVGELINNAEYEKALKQLTDLTDPLERFFEKILVMHQDERIKTNRLALLRSLSKVYLQVADFTKIVV